MLSTFLSLDLHFNNIINNELVEYRVPILGSTIPFIYVKYRPLKSRFGSKNKRVEIAKPEKYLSPDEQERIIKFCNMLGLDCGEMDILRDSDTKRIYIVDANHTPASPPYQRSMKRYIKALQIMSDVFRQTFTVSLLLCISTKSFVVSPLLNF